MPKKFDDMVSAIKASLKKQNPKMKEEDLTSRAFAIATKQWKDMHGGKPPSREAVKDWRLLEFFVPIEEKLIENDEFLIRGVAINETTTLNNVKYVSEELIKAASSFRNVPILLDHKNEVKNIVGRTTEKVDFNATHKRIDYEARIMDETIKEMIKDGRIQNVSIGAKVSDLIEEDDGSMKAIGIHGLEISLVAVPGDNHASLAQAIQNSFHLKEMAMENEIVEAVQDEPDTELNTKEKTEMVEELKTETIKIDEVKAVESSTPIAQVSQESADMSEMKKQIAELKELLLEKKKIMEKVDIKEDKTVGEVVTSKEESLEKIDNLIVERANRGFSMYKDYSKESANSNLKRLVR